MNRHLLKYTLLCLSVILIIIGCAAPFRLNKPLPEIGQQHLIHQIQSHASQLETFQGRARLSVISQDGSFQGTVKILAKTPDSLWMKIEGPLGVDLAMGRFDREQLLLYVPMENTVYIGFMDEIGKTSPLSFDVHVPDMLLGVLGLLIPPNNAEGSLLSVSSDNKNYILQSADGEQIWIEPKGPVVSRWEQRNGEDEVLWSWEGEDFKNNKGLRLPQIIRLTTYYPRQRITLFYESVETNRSMESNWAEIVLPESVQYVRL